LELQYVISQTRNGFNYKTLQQALAEEEQKPPRWTPENPIHIARAYLEERGGQNACSYADIARKFGVSRAEVCYHIGLVNRLPEEFVAWLEQCDDPKVLRVFNERQLRPITPIENQLKQWEQLKKLSGQLDHRLSYAKQRISQLANESTTSSFISEPREDNLLK
jgi:hypothetical protein